MASRALEVCLVFARRPDEQPIARVCDMAFEASVPIAFEGMHAMAAFQLFFGLRRIVEDELHDVAQRG